VDDIGREGLDVRKCKGHATEADVAAGRSTAFLKTGNEHADHFAGQGAQMAEQQSPSELLRAGYRQARQWYDWLFVLCSHWPADTQPRPKAKAKAKAAAVGVPRVEPPPGQAQLHPEAPHQLERGAQRIGCAVCRRYTRLSSAVAAQRAFMKSECKGPLEQRASGSTGEGRPGRLEFGPGHRLWKSGPVVWCQRCGAYAEVRCRELRHPCKGPAEGGPRAGQLARLKSGRHPLTGVELAAPVALGRAHGG